jgi:hypothetical protein
MEYQQNALDSSEKASDKSNSFARDYNIVLSLNNSVVTALHSNP